MAAAAAAAKSSVMTECSKILDFLFKHKDSGPFHEPVQWEEWGLLDYPKIIKQPMDLGSVKKKLDKGEYTTAVDFAKDVSLVWDNCMTYNADGSEYYEMAKRLKKVFQQKMEKLLPTPGGASTASRQPNLADKKNFSHNIYSISADELGKVVQMLDNRCDACIRKIDADDIEIDIDAIDGDTFWLVDKFVKSCMEASKGKAGAAAGAGVSAAKKAKTS